jgi:hypothetical protein
MDILNSLVELIKDPVRGPRFIVAVLAAMFLWIGFLQGIDANLWYDQGYTDPALIEEMQ